MLDYQYKLKRLDNARHIQPIQFDSESYIEELDGDGATDNEEEESQSLAKGWTPGLWRNRMLSKNLKKILPKSNCCNVNMIGATPPT